MQADAIRWLFSYDRWATQRVLNALGSLDAKSWAQKDAVGERSLGQILMHHLGASQRWRLGISSRGASEGPSPEQEPLPTIDDLRHRWHSEWEAVDTWLPTITDEFVAYEFDGVPVWQMLVHVVNHGTQHRSEAAAILTDHGCSPGELDMINYSEEQAAHGIDEG